MSLMITSDIATTILLSQLMTIKTLSAQSVSIHHRDADVNLTLLP